MNVASLCAICKESVAVSCAAAPSVVIRGLLTDAATLDAAAGALDDMYAALHGADAAPGGVCEVDERPFIEGIFEGDGGRAAAADRKLPGAAATGRHANGADHAGGGLLGSPFRWVESCPTAVSVMTRLLACSLLTKSVLLRLAVPGWVFFRWCRASVI